MRFTKLGMALLAALALSAVVASASQATTWVVSGTNLKSGESKAVKIQKESMETANLAFGGTVLGTELLIEGTGLEGSGMEIEQVGTGESGKARSHGKLVFTGLTVVKPAGCKIASSLTTEALQGEVAMGVSEATKNNIYEKLAPTSGEKLMTLKIEGCAAAGSYPVKGVFTCAWEHTTPASSWVFTPTNTSFTSQLFRSSSIIQNSQGTLFTIGGNPAFYAGVQNWQLVAGVSWSVKFP
jgi:hypothetical protein